MATAEAIVASNGGCCPRGNCFVQFLTQPQAAYVVFACRRELQNTESKLHLIDKLREKVNHCSVRVRPTSEYLQMRYRITPESRTKYSIVNSVCVKTFRNAWNISGSLIKTLRSQVKSGVVKSCHAMSDRYSAVSGDVLKLLESTGLDDVVNPDRLGIALLPNTEPAIHLYSWLDNHFKLSGDFQPNTGEIHLDPVEKKEVYEEYVNEATLCDLQPQSLTQFCKIWKDCFSNVKIRKYKACTGKCAICADFTVYSREHKTRKAMEYIRVCRMIHRADFMSDRALYNERKKLSELYPNEYLSIITDGMQQTHCELPYSGNRYSHGANKLKQHLQGITTHFRRTRMYRTLDHISLGANACVYTLLSALEEEYLPSGKLPRTVYIQIDGGSENANYFVLAWMEILIFLNLGADEIWVSRMRSGHNHADQDAKFGQLWKAVRKEFLLTPQAYARKIAEVLKEGKGNDGVANPAKLVDVFAIPNLISLVEPHLDKSRQHAFRGVYTQLVFRFERVPISAEFPLGSKCTYRASALDEFYEFVKNPDSPIGKSPRKVIAKWHPEDGTRFMTELPTPTEFQSIKAQSFVKGSVEHMKDIVEIIKDNSAHSSVVREWENFQTSLPSVGQTAIDFTLSKGLHIPFRDILYSAWESRCRGEIIYRSRKAVPTNIDYSICLPTVEAGASLRTEKNSKPEPARVTIDGRMDATTEDQKLRRSNKIRWRFDPKSIENGVVFRSMHVYIFNMMQCCRFDTIRSCLDLEGLQGKMALPFQSGRRIR